MKFYCVRDYHIYRSTARNFLLGYQDLPRNDSTLHFNSFLYLDLYLKCKWNYWTNVCWHYSAPKDFCTENLKLFYYRHLSGQIFNDTYYLQYKICSICIYLSFPFCISTSLLHVGTPSTWLMLLNILFGIFQTNIKVNTYVFL